MHKNRSLLFAFILSVFLSVLACNTARAPALTPTSKQITAGISRPTSSPLVTSPTQTPLPPTATTAPTSTPTSRPIAPTSTSAPFLPANLAVIGPQNAFRLAQVATLPGQGAGVVAYSPDSRRVAAGLFRSNLVKIWDLTSGKELLSLSGHADPRIISYLAFSPDGSSLASGAQGWDAPNDSLILWDTVSGRELERFNGVLGAISPDWRLSALTQREQGDDTSLVISDLASGEEVHSLQAPGDIYGVSFSPQSDQVAAKMFNVFQDLFAFWSIESGKLDRTQYDWLGFSYSPDGRFIAALLVSTSGDEKGKLNIFDATTFKWIKKLNDDADSLWYTYPAFSPDGALLAASFGDHVTLWDTQTWEEVASLPVSSRTGMLFSPDGRLLTTNTQSDGIQLWGVEGEQ
jgi:WD40 repeat protein